MIGRSSNMRDSLIASTVAKVSTGDRMCHIKNCTIWDSYPTSKVTCPYDAWSYNTPGKLPVAHRGRELAYASPPAQIPACALTHGAPASDDDEGQLARLRVLKPIAVTRETPTQSRLRKCVLHRLVGSAEWSFPPTVGICKPGDTNGGYPCWVSGTRY